MVATKRMEAISLEQPHWDDKGQQISFALERFHLDIRKNFFFVGRAAILWNNFPRDMAEKLLGFLFILLSGASAL